MHFCVCLCLHADVDIYIYIFYFTNYIYIYFVALVAHVCNVITHLLKISSSTLFSFVHFEFAPLYCY